MSNKSPQHNEELESERRQEKIEASTFDIVFKHQGKDYKGWVTPSPEKENDKPKSFHVVFNEVFFGNVSFNNGQWQADGQREHGLVQAVGQEISNQVD
jgi:hypothetical protein